MPLFTQDVIQIDRDCFSHCGMAKIHIHETGKLFEQLLYKKNIDILLRLGRNAYEMFYLIVLRRESCPESMLRRIRHMICDSTLGSGVTKWSRMWSRVWTPDNVGQKDRIKYSLCIQNNLYYISYIYLNSKLGVWDYARLFKSSLNLSPHHHIT